MIISVISFIKEFLIYNALTLGIANILIQIVFFLYSYCILLLRVKDGIVNNIIQCTGYNVLSVGIILVGAYCIKHKSVEIEFKELICNNIKSTTIGIILSAFLINSCIIGPTDHIVNSIIRVEYGLIIFLLVVWIFYSKNDALLNYVSGITLSMFLFMSYCNIADILWMSTWPKIETIILVNVLMVSSFRFISERLSSWLSIE